MAALPERRRGGLQRRRSVLDTVDNALLVVGAVVVILVVLHIFGAIAGAMFTLVKWAFLAGLIYLVAKVALRRRGRD